MTTATTPMTAWLVIWSVAEMPPRAAADDCGRLLAFARAESALLYAACLAEHGVIAAAQERRAEDFTDLLMASGGDPETAAERLVLVEAQATGEADLESWIRELVERALPGMMNVVAAWLD